MGSGGLLMLPWHKSLLLICISFRVYLCLCLFMSGWCVQWLHPRSTGAWIIGSWRVQEGTCPPHTHTLRPGTPILHQNCTPQSRDPSTSPSATLGQPGTTGETSAPWIDPQSSRVRPYQIGDTIWPVIQHTVPVANSQVCTVARRSKLMKQCVTLRSHKDELN